ncbi:MAG: arylsulfatase, partial [Pirellulales bacterium]|nr:arylsulfatase [Pirellulales bacterium]
MTFAGKTFLLTLAVWCGALPLVAGVAADKPNIIFILADDLGYGDVGFNGQQHIRTPCLDALAREGIVLTQHYAGSTVCMPSRCTIMTGKHTGHATVRGNPAWTAIGKPVNIGPDDTTVAEELQRAGYRTAIIGKWGLAEREDKGMPSRQGFDYFYGYRGHGEAHHYYPERLWRNDEPFDLPQNDTKKKQGDYAHDLVTEEALQWVTANQDEPFFLYLTYTIPHLELTVPQDSKQPYQNLGWPKRKMWDGHYHNDPEGNTAYAGMVSRMDRDIGRLIDLLKREDLAENTLVIFSSDNGPEYEKKDGFFNSNGPLRGGKRDLYEGGIRVPFVAWWPGKIAAGSRSDHISAFWDFLPTACELAGVQPSDSEIDGISLVPTLMGEEDRQQKHSHLYWEFNEKQGPIQAIRQGKWKAVKFFRKPLELYDLSTDVGEKQNVATEHSEIVQRMNQLLEQSRSEHPAFPLERRQR